MTAQVLAVTTKDVCGQFHGLLNIGGQVYPDKKVYLLPGTVENTLTFVLPDFTFGAKGKLGNIVLPNIPMSAEGQLTLENATLYLDSIGPFTTPSSRITMHRYYCPSQLRRYPNRYSCSLPATPFVATTMPCPTVVWRVHGQATSRKDGTPSARLPDSWRTL